MSFFGSLGSQLSAELDPRPQLFEEAAAVGPQVLGYEFAWKLRRWRSVPELTPHVGVETVDKFACGAAGAHLDSQVARSGDFMPRVAGPGITRTGDASKIPRKEREFLRALFQTSDITPPSVGRRRACQALN